MMNLAGLKGLVHLTSASLFAAMGTLGYDYMEHDQQRTFFDPERAATVLLGVDAPELAMPTGVRYDSDVRPAIVEFDWTGALPAPTGGIVISCPGCSEPLVRSVDEFVDAVMIQFSMDDPSQSLALLRLRPENGAVTTEHAFLHTGDTLPEPYDDVAVLDITCDGVLFSFEDEEREPEWVRLHHLASSTQIARASADRAASPAERTSIPSRGTGLVEPQRTKTIRSRGQFFLGTDDIATFAADGESILSRDVSSETQFKNGKRVGIKITRVAPGSIAARHGAREGDLIKSINGTPVTSKQDAIAFAKRNAGRYDVWRLEIENLGRTRVEVYHAPR